MKLAVLSATTFKTDSRETSPSSNLKYDRTTARLFGLLSYDDPTDDTRTVPRLSSQTGPGLTTLKLAAKDDPLPVDVLNDLQCESDTSDDQTDG